MPLILHKIGDKYNIDVSNITMNKNLGLATKFPPLHLEFTPISNWSDSGRDPNLAMILPYDTSPLLDMTKFDYSRKDEYAIIIPTLMP